MKKILVCILLVTLLAFALSGCSIISKFFGNKKDSKTALNTPTNFTYDEQSSTVKWDSVANAAKYEIVIMVKGEKDKVDTTERKSYYLGSLTAGDIQVKVRALAPQGSDKYKDSDYTDVMSIVYRSPVDIDDNSVKVQYANGSLSISWDVPAHAEGYHLSYNIGDNSAVHVDLTTPSYVIDDFVSTNVCSFTVYALGTGDYKDGKKSYAVFNGIPDYEHPFSTITVDKKDPKDASLGYPYVSMASINDEYINEYVELGTKSFVLPSTYWTKLDLGVYDLALYGVNAVRTYKLRVVDSTTPEISIDKFYINSPNLVGTITPYGNQIQNVCGFYAPLPADQAKIEGNTVIFFASYLNSLDEGEYKYNISYIEPLGELTKYLTFKVVVTSKKAELVNTQFDYVGDDLVIPYIANDDAISSLKCGSDVVPLSAYTLSSSAITLKSSYLDGGTFNNFTIITSKGATLSFSVAYLLNGFKPAQKVYAFDKANQQDLVISGKLGTGTLRLFGSYIVYQNYKIQDNKLVVKSDYLSMLDSGIYDYSAFCGGVVTSFSIKVYNSKGNLSNLNLDYDLDQSISYITFDCDCGENNHTYTLDGSSSKSCNNFQAVTVDREKSHTLIVKCGTLNKSQTYVITPNAEAKNYINSHFSINGVVSDKYINSIFELATVLKYVANGGDGIVVNGDYPNGISSVTVYLSPSFMDYTKSNSNYFQQANDMIDIPYACRFRMSATGNVATITAEYNYNPNNVVKSGKTTETLNDVIQYLQSGDRGSKFDNFKIDKSPLTEKIVTVGELEGLVLGVKPTFDSGSLAERTYNAAKTLLRKYVSDSMTDMEKVMTIYHILTSKVTYDKNALELYSLRNQMNGRSYSEMVNLMDSAMQKNGQLYEFLTPLLSYDNADDLLNAMAKKVSSLSSFSSYGALVENIAVCDGIASAFKLMCLIEGIDCIEVSGLGITSNGNENHAWNKVCLDGKWYIVDATWGRSGGYINHKYFLIDELTASLNHIENADSRIVTVVDVAADGIFDYYAWNVEPYEHNDMIVNSYAELQNLISVLMSNGETQFEIKLDYNYFSVSSEIKKLNLSCSYITYDNIVLITLKNK